MSDKKVFHVEEIEGFTCVFQQGNDVKRYGVRMQTILVHADDGIGYRVDWVLVPFANRFTAALAIPILRKRAQRHLAALTKEDHGEETENSEGEDGSGASA